MISRTVLGGDAILAVDVLGNVSRVDDSTLDYLLTAREQLQTAFGWHRRKGWPFAKTEDRWDLDDADRTAREIAFDGEVVEAVLVGLVSLSERSRAEGKPETTGIAAAAVSQLHDVAGVFGVRGALRQRLRERGGKVAAFSGKLDGAGPLVLDVPVEQG